MASPAEIKKKFSSADNCLNSSAKIGENQQQSLGSSFETTFGEQKRKMNDRILRKIWICSDVLMDIFPLFERVELGLKLALISDRFDILVDTHFDGNSELTIWRRTKIRKDEHTEKPIISVRIGGKNVPFPLPERPLPNKIRFNYFRIGYIDHSVFAFLRSNMHIWYISGTNLCLMLSTGNAAESNVQSIWDVFIREFWPFFAPIIRHLSITTADYLDTLLRLTSSTILCDLDQLISIHSGYLVPDLFDDDGPTATQTAGQALSKWLHTPRTDGRPKRLRCRGYINYAWINSFKWKFVRARTSASFKIHFIVHASVLMVPFLLVNERTNEKLTLIKAIEDKWNDYWHRWTIKRCQIGEPAAATIQPLSPPNTDEEEEEA